MDWIHRLAGEEQTVVERCPCVDEILGELTWTGVG